MRAPMNDELRDQLIRYLYDLPRRKRVQTAACDAIEGFCEDVCDWYVSDLLNTVKPMCNQQEYLFRSVRRRQMYVYCPHCNRRVIEQFDILKEEGV